MSVTEEKPEPVLVKERRGAVAVLRLNVRLDKVSQERVDLQADVARLQSALSSAGASAQISHDARSTLALVPADPNTTRYLTLAP